MNDVEDVVGVDEVSEIATVDAEAILKSKGLHIEMNKTVEVERKILGLIKRTREMGEVHEKN